MASVSIESLSRILKRLREGVALYEREPGNMVYLDALTKRFEWAFEISTATLYRYLRDNSVHLHLDEGKSLATIIRTGNKEGLLLGTWEQWSSFRETRNEAAHAYSESSARVIASKVPAFLVEVAYLTEHLRAKLQLP